MAGGLKRSTIVKVAFDGKPIYSARYQLGELGDNELSPNRETIPSRLLHFLVLSDKQRRPRRCEEH